MNSARYDGHADWYDQALATYSDVDSESSSAALLARLLGPGTGWCLDVACGTGLHFAAIESTGRRVFGIDISRDQLHIASRRATTVSRVDASRLPLASASIQTVVCTYLHTDTDDIASAFAEMARVLTPGGRLVYLGVHPCFRGHFVEHLPGQRVIHHGYWEAGWRTESPYRTYQGLRERVGEHHTTLSNLVNALLDSGLRLTRMEEADPSEDFADRIALTAIRP